MTKYDRLLVSLQATGIGQMRCYGNSMTPIMKSGSLCHYEVRPEYKFGDIVFCKVRGRWIDAHKVIATATDGRYLIANNHGHANGWTKQVYAKVVLVEPPPS